MHMMVAVIVPVRMRFSYVCAHDCHYECALKGAYVLHRSNLGVHCRQNVMHQPSCLPLWLYCQCGTVQSAFVLHGTHPGGHCLMQYISAYTAAVIELATV